MKQLQNAYRNMLYNQRRLAVILEALALAEQLDAPTRATVLYDLAWAYAMGDGPAKALPVCAEFWRCRRHARATETSTLKRLPPL